MSTNTKYELSDAVFDEVDRKLKQVEPIFDMINGSAKKNPPEYNSYKLVSVSGNNQTVEVNTRLEKPLIVQTTNKNGNGISNKTILFEVIAGNGKLANGRKQEDGNRHEWLGTNATDIGIGSRRKQSSGESKR